MKSIILGVLTLITVSTYAQNEPKNNWTAAQKKELKDLYNKLATSINENEATIVLIDDKAKAEVCQCALATTLSAYPDTKDFETAMADYDIGYLIGNKCFAKVLSTQKEAATKFVSELRRDKKEYMAQCTGDIKKTLTPKGGQQYCQCMYDKFINGTITYTQYLLYNVTLDTMFITHATTCLDPNELLEQTTETVEEVAPASEQQLYNDVVNNKANFIEGCTGELVKEWGKKNATAYCECMFEKIKSGELSALKLQEVSADGAAPDEDFLSIAGECIPVDVLNKK